MNSSARSFGIIVLCFGMQLIVPGQTRAAIRSTVFTNPAPADVDEFGSGIAAVGPDKIIIGAWRDDTGATDAGVAYLFTTSGKLLTTFTNPTPTAEEYFGTAVAAVGTDRVLIGAYCENTHWRCSGAAYLFRTDGALLMTFTNPVAKETDFFFGSAVAAVGPDKVLIGASGFNDSTLQQPGAAFLFSTNGSLQTIFTNPQPAAVRNFGLAVGALGTDRIIVGAVGRAFLFNTNGTLLTTFTNRASPGGDYDYFGPGFTTIGGDKVLIGAPRNDWAGTDSGRAYLFDTNGAVLITFNDPAPGPYRYFGSSFAVAGTNIVIGGYSAAYVFSSLNGTTLETITSPSAVSSTSFGLGLAAVGNNQLVISDSVQPLGEIYPGAAYLYSLSGPLHDGGIADLVPCDGPVSGGTWKHHRQYVNAVIETARSLFSQGVLTRREKQMVIRAAVRSDCGRKTK